MARLIGAVLMFFSIDQDGALSPRQLGQAFDQLRRIWHSTSVDVSSGRYTDPAPAGATRISLRVVGGVQKTADGKLVLGWVVDSTTTPMVFVSLGSLNEFLSTASVRGAPFTQRPLAFRQQLVGQAVGRILAHELGHYLLEGAAHTDRGLLRARYSPDDLLSPTLAHFDIPARDQARLRQEVARLGQAQNTAGRAR